MARSAFSTVAFAQLVRRLRYANARYTKIAHQCRSRQRLTYHAKRRAYFFGLRIDTSKARACPLKHISTKPLPVLATPLSSRTNLPRLTVVGASGSALELHLTNLPQIVVPVPVIPVAVKKSRVGMRQRLAIRVPPPLDYGYEYVTATPFQGPAPNAPLLKPAPLPEAECDMEEISISDGSSSGLSSAESTYSFESLLTPLDVAYSGLCITIPPRSLKRKLQDVDANETGMEVSPSQPKRTMKARWNKSQSPVRI